MSNRSRLVMTFSYSKYNPQIKLSQQELLEISQEINQEFAPDLSVKKQFSADQYKLSPQELFEISEEIRKDFAPGNTSNKQQELVLLPVDPDHLHVYWNIGNDKLNIALENDAKSQLTLRIYPVPNENKDETKTKSWIDLVIDRYQAQQRVFLPTRTHETAYRATIGKRDPENNLVSFVCSNVTHSPFGKTFPDQFKERQTVLTAMPQLVTTTRGTPVYTNNSASGQGTN